MTNPPAPQPYPTMPPSYQLPPGYEIKKKKRFYKRVWFWLLAIMLVVIIIVITAIASAAHDATSKPHDVVYTIGGTGKADITYSSIDGSGKQVSQSAEGVQIPWSKSFTIKGDFSGFDVTASSVSLDKSVTLTCEITVDGKVVSTDHATGHAAGVSCIGSGYDGK